MSNSQISKWKKIKRSGAFNRKVKKCYQNILGGEDIGDTVNLSIKKDDPAKKHVLSSTDVNEPSGSKDNAFIQEAESRSLEEENEINNWEVELEEDEEIYCNFINAEKNTEFRKSIRLWAVSFNVSHVTLKTLFQNINSCFPNTLPRDPRTLLKTYQTVLITKVGNGSYWHHGLELSLRQIFAEISDIPNSISINVNMDGLPIYRSSKLEFWPILFNIYEIPSLKPMIVGLYCGKGKPSDLTAYLQSFVEEAKILLGEGLNFNNKVINIKLRCFICDSPARAFIKGPGQFTALITSAGTKERLLYPNPLSINTPKYNDLVKLCDKKVIPKRFAEERKKFKHESTVSDTLPETDEEDTLLHEDNN